MVKSNLRNTDLLLLRKKNSKNLSQKKKSP